MKRLEEMSEDELAALFGALGKKIDRALPPGDVAGGKCGFILCLVDTTAKPKRPTCMQYTSNIAREDAPELLHEIADYIDAEIEAEEAEGSDT